MKRTFILAALFLTTTLLFAQSKNTNTEKESSCSHNCSQSSLAQKMQPKRHELKFFYGETVISDLFESFTLGMVDALSGNNRHTSRLGMFGVGYRYRINRFKVGADVTYLGYKHEMSLNKSKNIDYNVNEHNVSFYPTVEFDYYKRGCMTLYGGASAGVTLTYSRTSGKTPEGKSYVAKNTSDRSFSIPFNVNPISIRLGNDVIGGFLELNYGTKGLVNLGISYNF